MQTSARRVTCVSSVYPAMDGLWNALLCAENGNSESDGGRKLAAKAPSGALGVQGDGLSQR